MGYHTDFEGAFAVSPPLTDAHREYLAAFAQTRRMKRDPEIAATLPDPKREAVGLPIGVEGAYFVGAGGWHGQDRDDSILDYNSAPGAFTFWTGVPVVPSGRTVRIGYSEFPIGEPCTQGDYDPINGGDVLHTWHDLDFIRERLPNAVRHGPPECVSTGITPEQLTQYEAIDPADRQPGLWCQWTPNDDGTEIAWDEGEKFYSYVEWLHYLIHHFLKPWGYQLDGAVTWQGDEPDDRGKIRCVSAREGNTDVKVFRGEIVYRRA